MQVVFKLPVCSPFSVLSNPSSATTTRTSHTKSEVPTSRTGQREKSILGTPGLNSTMFAVFGPTESQTDTEDEQETSEVSQVVKKVKAKGKLREEDKGEGDVKEGKGKPKGNP